MDIGQPGLAIRQRLAHVERFLQQHSEVGCAVSLAMQVPPFFTRGDSADTSE